MIKILHRDVNALALRHYQTLVDYLKTANLKNRIEAINCKIQKRLGNGMDFKRLVMATPEMLEKLAKDCDKSHNEEFSFFKTLYRYFSTENKLSHNGNPYNGLTLVNDLDLSVCPYCNRNFILNTSKDGRRTCDFDHFFPSGEFPFLAVSFFNLIPSCKFCNQAKNDDWNTRPDKMLINPYESDERFPFDAKFQVKIKGTAFYYKLEDIEVMFKDDCISERFKNHIEAFHLDNLYKHHSDYVIELIQKKYLYSEEYLNALFKQYEGSIFRNREDILRLVTTNFVDEKDLKNRPLAKLTRDVVAQLNL
ncbi:MAG TPA: hypothetical protein PLL53_11470 [Saprospiraceae bacterium]|nr:hypothetical protein [Saprospiraceae bacterium]